jgi:branched-chain amino acid transport system permease protein
MSQFLQQIINGLSIGSVYALIALGYTMVYGIIKLINFAHGDIFMFGTYIGMLSITVLHLPFALAFIVAMVVTALLGVIIERVAYKPLRKSTKTAALITAIGVSFLIQNSVLAVMGANIDAFPQVIENRYYDFFGVRVNLIQLIIFFTSITLMFILQFIVRKTKLGRAMRSVAVDKDASALMGVNVDNTITITFAIGSALAAAAGIMVGLYYIKVYPFMGFAPGLKAFVAAVFGGIGIIPGAMIGGFSIGLIETMVAGYGSTLYKDAVVYGILILILLVKPSGLLGKNVKEKV